jgi:hypothetical protein
MIKFGSPRKISSNDSYKQFQSLNLKLKEASSNKLETILKSYIRKKTKNEKEPIRINFDNENLNIFNRVIKINPIKVPLLRVIKYTKRPVVAYKIPLLRPGG